MDFESLRGSLNGDFPYAPNYNNVTFKEGLDFLDSDLILVC